MQPSVRASGGFGMKIQSMKKMVMSGASWVPVSGTGGRLRFNPCNIQGNLKRAEGGFLLFVYVVPVFHISSTGEISASKSESSLWRAVAVRHKHIHHTLLSDKDLLGCLLAHLNISTKMTEVSLWPYHRTTESIRLERPLRSQSSTTNPKLPSP